MLIAPTTSVKLRLNGTVSDSLRRHIGQTWILITSTDITYVDKRAEEEKKRKADPQWYDLVYVDKRADEEKKRKADPQWYDLVYVDKRAEEEKKRKADPQWYDLVYVDKRAE